MEEFNISNRLFSPAENDPLEYVWINTDPLLPPGLVVFLRNNSTLFISVALHCDISMRNAAAPDNPEISIIYRCSGDVLTRSKLPEVCETYS